MNNVELIAVRGVKQRQTFRLKSEENILGRRKGCEVRIPSAEVSRQHCKLSVREGCLLVEDLGSANGTFVNKRLIRGEELIRPGDTLTVGPITFQAAYSLSPEAEANYSDAARSAPLALLAEQEEDANEISEADLFPFEDDADTEDRMFDEDLLVAEEIVEESESSESPTPSKSSGIFEEVDSNGVEKANEEIGLEPEDNSRKVNPYSRRRKPTYPSQAGAKSEQNTLGEDELDDSWHLPDEYDVRDLFTELDEEE